MSSSPKLSKYKVVNPLPKHFLQIQELCKKVYPFSKPWSIEQLESHRSYFPDGQWIVVDRKTNRVVGLAFSLIISWDDYSPQDNWQDFTSAGYFHNHNPRKGKTLYGAEVMVDPELQGQGIGKMLYVARKEIVKKYKLKRIRAGARLRGYSKFKSKLDPATYVKEVAEGRIFDPTLSFQLNQGYKVIDVAPNYLFNDPESLGYAAVIEWLNPEMVTAKDLQQQQQRTDSVLSGERFSPEFLPRELRRLVRKATLVLGEVIKEYEGEEFFAKVEYFRQQLKKTRNIKNKTHLEGLCYKLKNETPTSKFKLAHAFSLQLELVNACEAAYRTWRQRQKPHTHGMKSKLDLTFVLTSHPTEARSKVNVEIINKIQKILVEGVHGNFVFDEAELITLMRMIWLSPLSKIKTPTVLDEAEYIFSLVLAPELLDFILGEKPSYTIKLRTWVGGDKDGHPGINKDIMRDCLNKSRTYILGTIYKKLNVVLEDVKKLESFETIKKNEPEILIQLINGLKKIELVSYGDGTKIKAWSMKFETYLKRASFFIRTHHEMLLLKRLLQVFPAFVMPIELREDSGLIAQAIKDKSSVIKGMLQELSKICGALDITNYARGLVISHCETAEDIKNACDLVLYASKKKTLPVIPLFESKEALLTSKSILKTWFSDPKNQDLVKRYWERKFEVMLGYSDSSKQMGALPSRYLIAKSMGEIEKQLKSYGVIPIFFHGSGGSVARGGGSLKEQISWWTNAALEHPKFTIQGEMIHRQFATKEILNSQCTHLANEALKRKIIKVKFDHNIELDMFVKKVETQYSRLVTNTKDLQNLLAATPYKYLEILKIGSRPSKRNTGDLSLESLRAIPWVLCWTQVRSLLPAWWGVGSAWQMTSDEDRKKISELYAQNPFFSSYVKTLSFTLAKVELDIWELYFKDQNKDLLTKVRKELQLTTQFLEDITQEKRQLWFRPWLGESIKLRSAHIHILNMLQVHAMNENNEALLKETLVGIACGMLTTG